MLLIPIYPRQTCKKLKNQHESSLNAPKPIFGKLFFNPSTIKSSAANKSIKENKRNEIFVDVMEKISVLFNTSGYVINQSIDGCIQMKSFLKGNPPLKLQLCDDLQIGKNNGNSLVVLDDCNFHDCVNTSEFELSKLLRINPPSKIWLDCTLCAPLSLATYKILLVGETAGPHFPSGQQSLPPAAGD